MAVRSIIACNIYVCLNEDSEYETRCHEHTRECDHCGRNSTTDVCYQCSNTLELEQISEKARKFGYRLKRIKRV